MGSGTGNSNFPVYKGAGSDGKSDFGDDWGEFPAPMIEAEDMQMHMFIIIYSMILVML